MITDAEGNKKIAIESNIICKEYPITFSILNTNENKKFYKKTVKELNKIRKRQLMKKGIPLETFVKILKDNNISNIRRYHSFREEYIQMDLPYAIWLDYPDFRWNMTNSKKFYDVKECIQKIIELNEQYEEELEQIEDHVEKFDFLHSKDNKIPNHTLWKFYNAEQNDFIIFN
jgi:predicted transcriptional regulator